MFHLIWILTQHGNKFYFNYTHTATGLLSQVSEIDFKKESVLKIL